MSFEIKGLAFSIEHRDYSPTEKEVIRDVLKEFEFTDVNELVKQMDDVLSESYYVLIDDLDKAWVESKTGVILIKSLFSALVDIANLKRVKPVVSLRMNLFSQIKFSQPERLRPFIARIAWTDDELKAMIEKRFKHVFGFDPNFIWSHVFPADVRVGDSTLKIHKYLMRMSNRRPRDLLILIACALKYSKGKNNIPQDAFNKCTKEFSDDRLKNFIAEWNSPFSGLDRLLSHFQGSAARITGRQLRAIIDSMIVDLHILLKDKSGKFRWIEHGEYINLHDANQFDDPNGLFRLLFRLGTFGFKEKGTNKVRFSFDFEEITSDFKLEDDLDIFLNPALGPALTQANFMYGQDFDI